MSGKVRDYTETSKRHFRGCRRGRECDWGFSLRYQTSIGAEAVYP